LAYQRILLKLSGEALSSKSDSLDATVIAHTAAQIKNVNQLGIEVGIVVGGGNLWRGRSSGEMDRNRADHMGMLATAINALAMQDALQKEGVACTVLSAVEMTTFCDKYTARLAKQKLAAGEVVIFACGTGCPFFSTDTAAALRAAEIGADVLLLAKNVDAIYSADPVVHKDAIRYTHVSYDQVIAENLKATDLTAITMCKEQNIPLVAFGLKEQDSIVRAAQGESIGTLIDEFC